MKHLVSLIAVPTLFAIGLGCRTDPDRATEPVESVPVVDRTTPDQATVATAAVQDPEKKPAPTASDAKVEKQDPMGRPAPVFAANAFPPTVPDTEWHANAWMQNNCLRCHETGVGQAPQIVHRDLPEILLTAMCRTCHVLIPGSRPRVKPRKEREKSPFLKSAFPPMIPASASHKSTWLRDDCLLCHESGIRNAPRIVHEGMPNILLTAKCRSCHVQVRAIDAFRPER